MKGAATMALMGIDVGTTGVKCTVANNDGVVLAEAYREYQTQRPHDGWFELDPNVVWSATLETMYEAVGQASEPVLAVGVSSFAEAFTMVDAEGAVLTNFMVYTDPRGVEQIETLQRSISSKDVISRTSLKPSPTYSLGKLMWVREELPDVYARCDAFLPPAAFITYRLTGTVKAVDYALASRTLSFNVRTREWDQDIVRAAGLDLDIFPQVVQMGTAVGVVGDSVVESVGQQVSGMKVVMGTHDQIAALIGSGCGEEGVAMDGMGTVDCVAPVYGRSGVDVEGNAENGYPLVPYLDDTFTTYGYIFDGGASLKWFRDAFGAADVAKAKESGLSVYELLNQKAPSEPTGLLVLPHLSGSAMPYMDPFSRGMVVGFDQSTSRYELYRALMEGVAFELLVNIKKLEASGVSIQRLRATGGGSASDLWLQIKADVFNRPVEQMRRRNAGTLGLIIMAGVACGIFADFRAAMSKLNSVEKTFYPDSRRVAYYASQFERYQRLYQAQRYVMGRGDLPCGD